MLAAAGAGRAIAGEDTAILSRVPAFLAIVSFALAGARLPWFKGNPHRGFYIAALPLLAHLVHVNLLSQLDPTLSISNIFVLAVLCCIVESKPWLRLFAITWGCTFIACAWIVSEPQVSPVNFTILTLTLGVFLYLLASSYYSARRQLHRTKIELHQSQSLARVGSWEVDLRTMQPIWSDTTYKLLEWPKDKPLPTGFDQLVADPQSPGTLGQAINNFFNGADNYDEIGELLTAAGRPIWVHSRGQTLYNNGVATRKLGVFTDITRHMQREQALTEAKEVAEAAVVARTQFLANMSHEIRTPMNGVIGLTSLLGQSNLAAEDAKHVEIIRNCGESLLNIINDILDFAKLDAGKLQLEHTPFDLQHLVRGSADVVHQAALDKGLSLEVRVAPLNRRVMGDPGRLRQVLVNLLSNAVKFTHQGKVEVLVEVLTDVSMSRHQSATLNFLVKDTGIGISPEAQHKLFDAFSQADTSTTRKYGGTGLGLSICQELIQQMGGCIQVDSNEGAGAVFSFALTLPMSLEDTADQEALSARPPQSHAEPAPMPETADALSHTADGSSESVVTPANSLPALTILLAEDNLVNQRVAMTLLSKLGYQAQLVQNGAEAIAAVQETDFDLVLMDVQMPEMDGLEATRQIRQLDGVTQPRIIALTANALVEDRTQCLQAGMDDFLAKPVRFDDLQLLLSHAEPAQSPLQ